MNQTVVDLLSIVKRHGAAHIGTTAADKADQAMLDLFEHLPGIEWTEIEKARESYVIGGRGRIAFDEILNKLIQKYRHDPPARRTITML